MRVPLILGAAAAALGALAVTILFSERNARDEDTAKNEVITRHDVPDATDARGTDATSTRPATPGAVTPLSDPRDVADDAGQSARITEPPREVDLRMSPFEGSALLQREGQVPVAVAIGTLSFDVLLRGKREPIEATILNGHFETEIPSIARIVLTTGVFDGETVRFPGLEAPFDPTEDKQAIVGTPFPRNVLRVVDGGQRSPLTDVTVRRAGNSTAPLLAQQADTGSVVVDRGTAPVVLPWMNAVGPVWLRVSAPGYAASNVLVDPTRASDKEVALWPPADLTVRVTGPGRTQLKAIVLFLEGGAGRRAEAAIFSRSLPGVVEGVDSVTFPVVGLPAAPHRIVAKGYDGRGRAVDLGETRVDLGAYDVREAVLRASSPR